MSSLLFLWATVAVFGSNCLATDTVEIKLGLMLPSFDPLLKLKLGFPTTASAVTLAIDRIRREGILPAVDFKIIWNFTDCDESLSAGVGVELFRGDAVDVVIGPACTTEAMVIGVLGKHFNLPVFSWAAIGPELEDKIRYPTLVRTIGSAKKLGRALKEFLQHFRWHRIAMIVTDDHAARKCFFVARGIHEAFTRTLITFEHRVELDYASPSNKDMISFIDAIKTTARIVIICMDLIEDRRRFMILAQERLNVDEFVFIFPDYMPDEGKTLPWIDYVGTNDGKDDEARRAFLKSFIIEFQQADPKKLDEFKRAIPHKMREWPFFYQPQQDEQYGSTYSPFMFDATYAYALALNKTLRMGGNKRNGRLMFENSKNLAFEGISGPVNLNDVADREPDFVIKGFDQNSQYVTFIEAQMSQMEGQIINMKYPEWQIWETRKNKLRPRDTPACGFSNELCATETDYTGLIVGVVGIVFIGILIAGIGLSLYIRRKLNRSTIRKGMWKVSYGDIIKMDQVDLKSRTLSSGSQITLESLGSIGSLGSHPSRKFENAELAFYKGSLVWVRNHHHNITVNHTEYQNEFRMMWEITHPNLNRFIGLCIDSPVPLSLWKFNSKGSLKDILKNENVKLNWLFAYSLVKDLAEGMEYLHIIPIGSHGRLRPSNCVVDSRWVLKVTDFGLTKIRSYDKLNVDQLMWTAPELLRMGNPPPQGTPKGDVFSFSIIVQQLILRNDPYCGYEDDQLTPEEILMHVKRAELPPFRPILKLADSSDINTQIVPLLKECWHEAPDQRPDFKTVKQKLKAMEKGKHIDLMDHVLNMMERYAGTLESQIGERTKQLVEEKKKSDLLLYRMLPRTVADKLKLGQRIEPESYECATVFFSDIVGFTALSNRSNPLQIVSMLNDLFAQFDETIDEYDVYKVETIGDGYMCVSGLPHRNGTKHVSEIACLALHFQKIIKEFIIPHMPGEFMKLRIGVHSGPVVTGVVGLKLPRFCLFGDTVNTASRMESHGKAGCIHITEETNRLLTTVIGGYRTKPRGEMIVKGKGVLNTFFLLGKVGSKNIDDNTEAKEKGRDATSLGAESPPLEDIMKVPLQD